MLIYNRCCLALPYSHLVCNCLYGCMYCSAASSLSHRLQCGQCSCCHGCRAREKINKPLLRNRRRGNDFDSLQKLQTIRQNQLDAIKVVQFLIKRERKKRDIAVRAVLCNATCVSSSKQSSLLQSAFMSSKLLVPQVAIFSTYAPIHIQTRMCTLVYVRPMHSSQNKF